MKYSTDLQARATIEPAEYKKLEEQLNNEIMKGQEIAQGIPKNKSNGKTKMDVWSEGLKKLTLSGEENKSDILNIDSETFKKSFLLDEDDKKDIMDVYNKGVTVKLASNFETLPIVYYFKNKGVDLPQEIKSAIETKYDFYSVEITFRSIIDEHDIYLKRAELTIEITDDVEKKERQTRVYKLFPDGIYKDYFKAYAEGKIALDAGLNFSLSIPDELAELIDAKIKPEACIDAGIDFDLGSYTFRKAKVEAMGESDKEAVWIYNMNYSEKKNDDYKSIVILKVPEEAKKVTMCARLKVSPCRTRWDWKNLFRSKSELQLPPLQCEPVKLLIELQENN